MNILLTSVGRRAYLVKYFKEALGNNGKIYVCNSDEKSIAFHYADEKVVSPLIYDEEYIPFLVNFCQENKIDIILSLFDIDLAVLAKNKQKFEAVGTRVIVSDYSLIEICNDKWKTYCFLTANGFYAPRTYLDLDKVRQEIECGNIKYPIIVKPRFGCGSISVASAYDEEDLLYLTKKAREDIDRTYLKYESATVEDKVLYQECLCGQEYGADIINDLDGNYRNVIVRKKLAMRSGETDIAELVDEPVIKETLEKLGRITKHIGNMDCDIFLVEGVPYILELNARFGGGYPFSHMGGCNLPQAIINWANGEDVDQKLISAKSGITGFKEIVITAIDAKSE